MSDTGQNLCLSCGMCCDGTFFSEASSVHATEPVEEFRQMGLQIEQRTDSLKLLLPCLLFSNGKCQTYGFRPKICSGYRCRLLIRVETRQTTLANAKRTLEVALRMRSRIQHLLGKHFPELADTPILRLGKLVRERMDGLTAEQGQRFRRTHGEFLVTYFAFASYVETNFIERESIED